jgi:hypothetical protein
MQLISRASYYKPADSPAQLRAANEVKERWKFPQVSVMVLPPPLENGLHLALFSKINRRILMDIDSAEKMKKQFDSLYQVSGIAHWKTPPEYERELLSKLDDPKPFRDGTLDCIICWGGGF